MMETSGNHSVSPTEFYAFAAGTFGFFVVAFLAIQLDMAWLTMLGVILSLFLQLNYTRMLFRARRSSRSDDQVSPQP